MIIIGLCSFRIDSSPSSNSNSTLEIEIDSDTIYTNHMMHETKKSSTNLFNNDVRSLHSTMMSPPRQVTFNLIPSVRMISSQNFNYSEIARYYTSNLSVTERVSNSNITLSTYNIAIDLVRFATWKAVLYSANLLIYILNPFFGQ